MIEKILYNQSFNGAYEDVLNKINEIIDVLNDMEIIQKSHEFSIGKLQAKIGPIEESKEKSEYPEVDRFLEILSCIPERILLSDDGMKDLFISGHKAVDEMMGLFYAERRKNREATKS
jgi:hypothetical protein